MEDDRVVELLKDEKYHVNVNIEELDIKRYQTALTAIERTLLTNLRYKSKAFGRAIELVESREEFVKSEKELSDSFLRIRKLVNAYDTKPGGEDRFEVTENKIRELVEENRELKEKYQSLEKQLIEERNIKEAHLIGTDAQSYIEGYYRARNEVEKLKKAIASIKLPEKKYSYDGDKIFNGPDDAWVQGQNTAIDQVQKEVDKLREEIL